MYAIKGKNNVSLYKTNVTKYPKHKDTEVEAHIAYVIGNDMYKKMHTTVSNVTSVIVNTFSK